MAKKTVWVRPQDLTEDELMGIVALARRNLVERHGCLEWGSSVTSGNRHRCRLGSDDAGNDRVVRTQDVLLFKAGEKVPDGGKYSRTCNNPRCMNPQHLSEGGQWSKYSGDEGKTLYQQDMELATKMLQFGWSYQDIVATTSVLMYTTLTKDGVSPAADVATREPLTYAELLRLAEALRSHRHVVKHVSVIADSAKIDINKLIMNGQAVKALRRRMSNSTGEDEVIWFLSGLCNGQTPKAAAESINKPTTYGTLLLGACYG